MEITLKTLTPLWTGGIDQTCDRLHETGLIGSLRWWYEALVRGLGGCACDPTAHSCTFDEEKYRKSKVSDERQRLVMAGVCDACQLFGCTGWGRRFRLQVSDGNKFLNWQNILIPSGRKHGERAGGWFVFGESRVGEIVFDLIPLRDADLCPIHTVLALISRHASLGPKGASGYGVIQADGLQLDLDWTSRFPSESPARKDHLPDFRDFFFARFQFDEPANNSTWWQAINGIRQAVEGKLDDGSSPKPLKAKEAELEQMVKKGVLPIAPAIRNWLRYQWRHSLSRDKEQSVFGDARSAIGSKILVSYAYRLEDGRWEFRIWGWLPCQFNNRDNFLESLKTQFQETEIWDSVFGTEKIIRPTMTEWHSLNCQQTDGCSYLKELLGGAP